MCLIFCILYSLSCILYSVFCILYPVFCILYSLFSILKSELCALYPVFCNLLKAKELQAIDWKKWGGGAVKMFFFLHFFVKFCYLKVPRFALESLQLNRKQKKRDKCIIQNNVQTSQDQNNAALRFKNIFNVFRFLSKY